MILVQIDRNWIFPTQDLSTLATILVSRFLLHLWKALTSLTVLQLLRKARVSMVHDGGAPHAPKRMVTVLRIRRNEWLGRHLPCTRWVRIVYNGLRSSVAVQSLHRNLVSSGPMVSTVLFFPLVMFYSGHGIALDSVFALPRGTVLSLYTPSTMGRKVLILVRRVYR